MSSKAQRIVDLEREIEVEEKSLTRLREQLAKLTYVNPDPFLAFLERLEEEANEWYRGPDHSGRFEKHFGKLIMEFVQADRDRIAARLDATMKLTDAWAYVNPDTRGAIRVMIQSGGE